MPMQSWSSAEGKAWGNGAGLEKTYKDIESDIKRIESKLASMDKAELEKLMTEHNKQLAAAKALKDQVAKARIAWFRNAETAKKKDEEDARKKVEAMYKEMIAPLAQSYSQGSRESTDCDSAASNVHYALDQFTAKIEKALKAKR